MNLSATNYIKILNLCATVTFRDQKVVVITFGCSISAFHFIK